MKLISEPFEKTIEDLATITLKNKGQSISLIGPVNERGHYLISTLIQID